MTVGPARGTPGRRLAVVAAAAVAATVVAAIIAIGSPATQRQLRLDERRVEDLQHIDMLTRLYAQQRGALPPNLTTLAAQPGQRVAVADPAGGEPYDYEVTGRRTFRICAVFTTDTAVAGNARGGDEWNHAAGRQCFDRRVEEEAMADPSGAAAE